MKIKEYLGISSVLVSHVLKKGTKFSFIKSSGISMLKLRDILKFTREVQEISFN